jgi:hypothetical protein
VLLDPVFDNAAGPTHPGEGALSMPYLREKRFDLRSAGARLLDVKFDDQVCKY